MNSIFLNHEIIVYILKIMKKIIIKIISFYLLDSKIMNTGENMIINNLLKCIFLFLFKDFILSVFKAVKIALIKTLASVFVGMFYLMEQ